MTTISIKFDASESTRFPLYAKYANQFEPQPAFLELDCQSGDLTADYSGEIGGGTPAAVWHNLVLRFPISSSTKGDDIQILIEEYKDRFQLILDGFSCAWNGSNWVGKYSDTAERLIIDINRELEQSTTDTSSIVIDADCFGEWLCEPFCTEDQSLDDYVTEVLSCDGDDERYLSDELLNPAKMKEAILDLWAEQLYSGETLPKHIAQILLTAGTCEDSAWMKDLEDFAK